MTFRDGLMSIVHQRVDFTARQLAVLFVAHEAAEAPHTQADIGRTLKLPPPVISRSINKLVEAGLVKRAADIIDTRLVRVVPLMPGRRLVDRLTA